MFHPLVSYLVLLCCSISLLRRTLVWATTIDTHTHDALHQSSPRSSFKFPGAPDFSHDSSPPYPPLSEDGDVNGTGLLYTRLFGWKGCSTNEKNIIKQTYNDFCRLAQQKSLWQNIDWNSQPAQEFWGHATQPNKQISDTTKREIKQIYEATQQVYDRYFGINPFLLYIRVQCSPDGDDGNKCGDKPTPDPKCPGRNKPVAPQGNRLLEAYSEPEEDYSKITFCNRFFNVLQDLDIVMNSAKRHSRAYQKDLWNYQNRARCFFHEITHLNYFVNAPKKSPYTDDLTLNIRGKSNKAVVEDGYGPENVKAIANYERVNLGGMFAQRNADTYAWYAMAKWVEDKIGNYPYEPVVRKRPYRAPRDGDGKPFYFADSLSDDDEDGIDATRGNTTTVSDNSTEDAIITYGDYYIPGCPDHFGGTSVFGGLGSNASDSSSSVRFTPTPGPDASAEASRASVVMGATTDAEASQDSAAASQITAYQNSQAAEVSSASSRDASFSSASYSTVAQPTASMLVIWDVSLETGPAEYKFIDAPPTFNQPVIPDTCGDGTSSLEVKYDVFDPKQGRVDDIRHAGQVPQRQAPGYIDLDDNCAYEEYDLGNATFVCDNHNTVLCTSPDHWWNLANTLTPDNGAANCEGVQKVANLVMVCPYGAPGL